MKKIIGVTGYKGKIGSCLVSTYENFVPLQVDVTKINSLIKAKQEIAPDFVVHCAAITSIDECETKYNQAIQVNVLGTRNVCDVFGDRVLLLSSDHIFNGRSSRSREISEPCPINNYGFTKLAAEGVCDGKTMRLSRVVSILDKDISSYLQSVWNLDQEIEVPDFIYRNYCHVSHVVQAIHFFMENFGEMPYLLHYGGKKTISFYDLMKQLSERLFPEKISKLKPRTANNPSYSPRPFHGGFVVKNATSLGFPMFSPYDVVTALGKELGQL